MKLSTCFANIAIILLIASSTFQNKLKTNVFNNRLDLITYFLASKPETVKNYENSYVEHSKTLNLLKDGFDEKKSKELLSKLKAIEEPQTESNIQFLKMYLIFRMSKGDQFAQHLYSLEKDQNPSSRKSKIDQKNFKKETEQILKITGSLNSCNYAKFSAYTILTEQNSLDKLQKYRITVKEGENDSKPQNRAALTKSNSQSWNDIKFYKTPKQALKLMDACKDYFPKSFNHVNSNPNCQFTTAEPVEYAGKLEDINLHPDCSVQIIGPDTNIQSISRDDEITFKVNMNNQEFMLNIYYPKDDRKPYYNCMGWAFGIEQYIGVELFMRQETVKVKNREELLLFMLQFVEADKISKRLKDDGSQPIFSEKYFEHDILDNKLDKTNSILMKLKENENIFADNKHLVGLKPDLTQEKVSQVCSNLDGAILIYGSLGYLTHGARFISKLNSWTSKLGHLDLITHGIDMLNTNTDKDYYGSPMYLYCSEEIKLDAEIVDVQKTDFMA